MLKKINLKLKGCIDFDVNLTTPLSVVVFVDFITFCIVLAVCIYMYDSEILISRRVNVTSPY